MNEWTKTCKNGTHFLSIYYCINRKYTRINNQIIGWMNLKKQENVYQWENKLIS